MGPSQNLCAEVVRYLQLATPNACSRQISDLSIHKDKEPVHAYDQVMTLCHGVGDSLVLEDNTKQEVACKWLEYVDFHIFRDQSSFYYGVDGWL